MMAPVIWTCLQVASCKYFPNSFFCICLLSALDAGRHTSKYVLSGTLLFTCSSHTTSLCTYLFISRPHTLTVPGVNCMRQTVFHLKYSTSLSMSENQTTSSILKLIQHKPIILNISSCANSGN